MGEFEVGLVEVKVAVCRGTGRKVLTNDSRDAKVEHKMILPDRNIEHAGFSGPDDVKLHGRLRVDWWSARLADAPDGGHAAPRLGLAESHVRRRVLEALW